MNLLLNTHNKQTIYKNDDNENVAMFGNRRAETNAHIYQFKCHVDENFLTNSYTYITYVMSKSKQWKLPAFNIIGSLFSFVL